MRTDSMKDAAWVPWLMAALLATGCDMLDGGSGSGGGGGGSPSDGGLVGGGGGGDEDPGCSVTRYGADPFVTDTCAGREICICPFGDDCPEGGGRCEPAFSRRYSLRIDAVVFPERKSNGDCWDFGCGAPDPYVNVWVDDDFVGGTPTRQDTFRPEWGPGSGDLGRVTVIDGSVLYVEANDEDISKNDPGLYCEREMDGDFLRRRLIACVAADGEVGIWGLIVP